jgi:hypothetical protein
MWGTTIFEIFETKRVASSLDVVLGTFLVASVSFPCRAASDNETMEAISVKIEMRNGPESAHVGTRSVTTW